MKDLFVIPKWQDNTFELHDRAILLAKTYLPNPVASMYILFM